MCPSPTQHLFPHLRNSPGVFPTPGFQCGHVPVRLWPRSLCSSVLVSAGCAVRMACCGGLSRQGEALALHQPPCPGRRPFFPGLGWMGRPTGLGRVFPAPTVAGPFPRPLLRKTERSRRISKHWRSLSCQKQDGIFLCSSLREHGGSPLSYGGFIPGLGLPKSPPETQCLRGLLVCKPLFSPVSLVWGCSPCAFSEGAKTSSPFSISAPALLLPSRE